MDSNLNIQGISTHRTLLASRWELARDSEVAENSLGEYLTLNVLSRVFYKMPGIHKLSEASFKIFLYHLFSHWLQLLLVVLVVLLQLQIR